MTPQSLGPLDSIRFRAHQPVIVQSLQAFPDSVARWWERAWTKSLDFLTQARFSTSLVQPAGRQGIHPSLSQAECAEMAAKLIKRKSMRAFRRLGVSRIDLEACLNVLYSGKPFSDGVLDCRALRVVCVIFDVESVSPGIYEFDPADRSLRSIRSGDFRKQICTSIAGMATSMSSNFCVFLCADFVQALEQTDWGSFALRKVYYYCGYVTQRLLARANTCNILGVPTPALSDSQIAELFGMRNQSVLPIYSISMGRVND
ncbi:MAG: hypothetical protein KF799_13280 [Bdellovibrionales bacterium]|nr:hypothetical protein [Bdellovibrionales bacterium]